MNTCPECALTAVDLERHKSKAHPDTVKCSYVPCSKYVEDVMYEEHLHTHTSGMVIEQPFAIQWDEV